MQTGTNNNTKETAMRYQVRYFNTDSRTWNLWTSEVYTDGKQAIKVSRKLWAMGYKAKVDPIE